jgi:peptidoglycan/xylan/chitin deacetylase (PgdA/CDA1 family)
MRFLSPLLKHAAYPVLHRTGLFDRIMPPQGFTVVNYHGVTPPHDSTGDIFLNGNLVAPEAFRQQIQFLKAHYDVIDPEDFRAWIERGKPLPPRAALVTCDDGLANTLTDMLPVLQSEGVPCLFFVTTASCCDDPGMLWYDELYLLMRLRPLTGRDLQLPSEDSAEPLRTASFAARWWATVRRASRLEAQARAEWMDLVRTHCGSALDFRSLRRWQLLNISELRQLAATGMSIGAHTRSHPVLSVCSQEEARRELHESKADLERVLGRPVWAFAYPFGHPSTIGEREVRLAREAPFACAFINVESWGSEHSNPFKLSRIHVTSDMTLPEFAAHLSGVHARLKRSVGC